MTDMMIPLHSRYVGIAALAVIVLFLSGCASWGTYGRPTDEDVRFAASAIKPASRQEAMRELKQTFRGIQHVGKLIFDDCNIESFNEWSFDVSCTSYKGDPNSKEFRLIVEGSHAMTVAYCEPTFRAVRQVPTMAHYFLVNGFSFMGDANRALKAYGLLTYLCTAEK